MDCSEKRRISFVKLSERDLKDFGFCVDTQTQGKCQSDTPSVKRIPSFVKLSEKDMKDLGLLPVNTENIQRTCEPVSGNLSRKWQNIQPPIHRSVTSLYKTRSSTISKRSIVSKKSIKKKTVAIIRDSLYNSSDRNKNNEIYISEESLGGAKKAGKSAVRKELFKFPVTKPTKNSKRIPMQGNEKYGAINFHRSPLMDIDKAEMLLKKQPCIQKSLFKASPLLQAVYVPNLPIISEATKQFSPSTSGTSVKHTTDNSSYPDDLEFEVVEKSEQQERETEYLTKIRLIHEILDEDRDEFQRYNEAHQKRINDIYDLLTKISNHSKFEVRPEQNSGENHLRTSTPSRQTPVSRKKVQRFTARSQKKNLRIELLKTNLNKSINKTPKQKKAQNMYNALRKTFSLLETPKFGSTSNGKGKPDLSLKLQEQCLRLFETPQHN